MTIRERNCTNSNKITYEASIRMQKDGMKFSKSKSGFTSESAAKAYELILIDECNKFFESQKNKKTLLAVFDEFVELEYYRYQENTLYNCKKTKKYWAGEDATIDLGSMAIDEINYKILQTYFNARKNAGLATNLEIKKTISRIFKYAMRCDYISKNPVLDVHVSGQESAKENTPISEEDFQAIIDELKSKSTFRSDAIVIALEIGYFTGLRLSEVLALKKSDIQGDFIKVQRKLVYKGKGGQPIADDRLKSKKSGQNIPIPTVLKSKLDIWFEKNPHDIVCCKKNGDYLNPDSVGNTLRKISKNIGIENFHFHLLRHTYCTNIVEHGVDPRTAQDLMRHASINTTMSIYAHVMDKKKLNVINEIF